MTLYKFNKRKGKYISVHPDEAEYYAIPELDLAIRLLDGWARYWWNGKLLPIPTELQAELVRVEKENAALRRENADQTKILDDQSRLLTDQARAITDKDRLIADMQAELERFRKSVG